MRKKYNEFGQKNGGGGVEENVDPEEVFGKMFGGDRFEDLIGVVSIGEEIQRCANGRQGYEGRVPAAA